MWRESTVSQLDDISSFCCYKNIAFARNLNVEKKIDISDEISMIVSFCADGISNDKKFWVKSKYNNEKWALWK